VLTALVVAVALALFSGPARAAPPRGTALWGAVNLNTASAFELSLLPGIGSRKAVAIVEHRQKRPFRFPEQIVKVKGIGRGTFRRLKPFLVVEGETTLRLVEPAAEDTPPAPGP
jgi:competence protein ComEA